MHCDFTSFSTVFQSYQDDGRVIMKGCVQCKPGHCWKELPSVEIEPGTTKSVGQLLTYCRGVTRGNFIIRTTMFYSLLLEGKASISATLVIGIEILSNL